MSDDATFLDDPELLAELQGLGGDYVIGAVREASEPTTNFVAADISALLKDLEEEADLDSFDVEDTELIADLASLQLTQQQQQQQQQKQQQQKQQQQYVGSAVTGNKSRHTQSATLTRVPPREASLEIIQRLKVEALALNKAGDKPGAVAKMKQYKEMEKRLAAVGNTGLGNTGSGAKVVAGGPNAAPTTAALNLAPAAVEVGRDSRTASSPAVVDSYADMDPRGLAASVAASLATVGELTSDPAAADIQKAVAAGDEGNAEVIGELSLLESAVASSPATTAAATPATTQQAPAHPAASAGGSGGGGVTQEQINGMKEKMFALNQAGKIREAGALRKQVKVLEAQFKAQPTPHLPPSTASVAVKATAIAAAAAAAAAVPTASREVQAQATPPQPPPLNQPAKPAPAEVLAQPRTETTATASAGGGGGGGVTQEQINGMKEKMFALNQAGKIREAGALRKQVKVLEAQFKAQTTLPAAAAAPPPPAPPTAAGALTKLAEEARILAAAPAVPAAPVVPPVAPVGSEAPAPRVGSSGSSSGGGGSGAGVSLDALRARHQELSAKARGLLREEDKAAATAVYRQAKEVQAHIQRSETLEALEAKAPGLFQPLPTGGNGGEDGGEGGGGGGGGGRASHDDDIDEVHWKMTEAIAAKRLQAVGLHKQGHKAEARAALKEAKGLEAELAETKQQQQQQTIGGALPTANSSLQEVEAAGGVDEPSSSSSSSSSSGDVDGDDGSSAAAKANEQEGARWVALEAALQRAVAEHSSLSTVAAAVASSSGAQSEQQQQQQQQQQPGNGLVKWVNVSPLAAKYAALLHEVRVRRQGQFQATSKATASGEVGSGGGGGVCVPRCPDFREERVLGPPRECCVPNLRSDELQVCVFGLEDLVDDEGSKLVVELKLDVGPGSGGAGSVAGSEVPLFRSFPLTVEKGQCGPFVLDHKSSRNSSSGGSSSGPEEAFVASFTLRRSAALARRLERRAVEVSVLKLSRAKGFLGSLLGAEEESLLAEARVKLTPLATVCVHRFGNGNGDAAGGVGGERGGGGGEGGGVNGGHALHVPGQPRKPRRGRLMLELRAHKPYGEGAAGKGATTNGEGQEWRRVQETRVAVGPWGGSPLGAGAGAAVGGTVGAGRSAGGSSGGGGCDGSGGGGGCGKVVNLPEVNRQFAQLSELERRDPLNAQHFVSEAVIEHEMKTADEFRRMTLDNQMLILRVNMESGQMTPELYLGNVTARISRDIFLAKYLVATQRRQEAAKVVARTKVMKQELGDMRAMLSAQQGASS